MTWYLIAFFVGSVEIHRVDGKAACDALRAEVLGVYQRGSGLVDVRCVSVADGGTPSRK